LVKSFQQVGETIPETLYKSRPVRAMQQLSSLQSFP